MATVLACCGMEPMLGKADNYTQCTMGVDTGNDLHVVISRRIADKRDHRQIVYIGVHHAYSELDELISRFRVNWCVIDALPEIHATREFATRHPGIVWLNYFLESQRGEPKWDAKTRIVQENRTEALDMSRQAIRDRRVVLPRQSPIVVEFARHMAADAKRLEEDPDTGAQAYRYIRTGPDHLSLAYTYDTIAALRDYVQYVHPRPNPDDYHDPVLDNHW